MIDTITIGKIIKKLRTQKHLTQEELAEKIDISTNYLSKIERGISKLNVESFLKMAEVLQFSLEDFGINSSVKSNQLKNNLITQILATPEKEVEAYMVLFNSVQSIKEILKY